MSITNQPYLHVEEPPAPVGETPAPAPQATAHSATANPIPRFPHRSNFPRIAARERRPRRILWLCMALLTAVGYFIALLGFWTPGSSGVDQNGYLVGGKMIADHASTGYMPPDPYSFVGHMWVVTPWGVFYPKYPIGLPALFALMLKLGGAHGVTWAYLVNPVCMTLGLIACYLILRMAVGSMPALLGMIAIAASPITLNLTDTPNSHASDFFCVAWGMYLLLRWWKVGGMGRSSFAGFLLGYAITIRYTEGLLVLPLLLVALFNLHWRQMRCWVETAMLLVWWTIPPLGLVCFNLAAMGSITGYDSTNESTGFAWDNFVKNWEPMIRQMYQSGLFFLLPLALLGIFLMFFRAWRLALALTLWTLPSALLYTAYYWAPDNQQVGVASVAYLRFFLTILPPLAVGAYWVLGQVLPASTHAGPMHGAMHMPANPRQPGDALPPPRPFGPAAIVAAGVITLASAAMSLYSASPLLEQQFHGDLFVEQTADLLTHQIRVNGPAKPGGLPAGSLVFSNNQGILNNLQFVGDYTLYDDSVFNIATVERQRKEDPDQPNPLQPERAEMLYKLMHGLNASQLSGLEDNIVSKALKGGHRVFIVTLKNQFEVMQLRYFPPSRYAIRMITTWLQQPEDIGRPLGGLRGAGGPGAIGGPGGAANRRAMARALFDRQQTPQIWSLIEVTAAAPTRHPAIRASDGASSR